MFTGTQDFTWKWNFTGTWIIFRHVLLG